VAHNLYRNWARGRRRRERILSFDSSAVEQAAAATETEPSEQIERLRQAIERLSDEHRQVVLMHYLEETSVKEVASLLSLPAKTVEGRLYQARKALFRMLDNEPPAALIGKVLICL
jgi:RNA polymerase sigma-70 factor (ECF subfamily)